MYKNYKLRNNVAFWRDRVFGYLTQEKFAKKIGISRQHLSGIENQKIEPKATLAIYILELIREYDANIKYNDVFWLEEKADEEKVDSEE
jgi:DNA-binding XRE family transcriptional regulator